MAKSKHSAPDADVPDGVPPDAPAAPSGDAGKDPPHGTAVPADPGGPVPRVVRELERAPAGLTRFKVACRNFDPAPATKYVLARDEASARDHYLAVTGLAARVERLKANGAEKVEPPLLAVTRLPD